MGRGRRRQQLKAVLREIGEARRVRSPRRPSLRQGGSTPAVEVGERCRHRQVRNRHVLGKRVDAMQLFQRLRGRRGVVIANLGHADHGHPAPRQRTKLASRDCGGYQVGGPRQPMDVRVQAAIPPPALELEASLFERQVDRLDGRVQLGGNADGIQPQPGERVVWLRPEHRFEVVDDLHAAGVQRGGARRPSHHSHVRSGAPRGQCGAIAREPSADDDDARQGLTIRRVSATSRRSCSTSSSVFGNLISACR